MIKLELSDTIIEIHKEYFKEKVKFNQKIHIEEASLDKLNKELEYKEEEIKEVHLNFLKYFKNMEVVLRAENPEELKSIILEIYNTFSVIQLFIDNNILCKPIKKREYKDYNQILYYILSKNKINLEQKIDIEDQSLKKFNETLDKNYKKNEIGNIHFKFLNYFDKISYELLIGNIRELKLIIKEVNYNIELIQKMINVNMKCKFEGDKTYKAYNEFLYDILSEDKINLEKKIDIEKNSLKKFNESLNKNYKENEIEDIHSKFLNYCNEMSDILSVGNVNQLRLMIRDISLNYRIIQKMIENDIECKIIKDENFKNYKEVLYNILKRKKLDFNQKINIEENSLEKFNQSLNKNFKKEEIENLNLEFLDYCKKIKNLLPLKKIKDIDQVIKETNKFEKICIIQKMIDEKIQCKPIKDKNENYSNILIDIFGYNKFISKNFIKLKDNKISKSLNIPYKVKKEIKDSIKKSKYNFLKENTIDDVLRILCNKWKIDSQDIIDNRNKFIDYWCAYLFVYLIDLRVCPYCNRQYITPILTKSGGMRGDLDHFLPKSKYPYLSMSIYNLIPVCKFCNSSLKGDNEFKENDLNPYEKSFDDYVKFYFDINLDNINIKIKKNDDNDTIVDNYIDMFKLNNQYEYHTNKVKELIQKRVMYSEEYVKDIRDSIFHSKVSIEKLNEIIIGYTAEKSKINDEPLSKLKRDISKQLGLFKDMEVEKGNIIEKDLSEKELIEKLRNILNYKD